MHQSWFVMALGVVMVGKKTLTLTLFSVSSALLTNPVSLSSLHLQTLPMHIMRVKGFSGSSVGLVVVVVGENPDCDHLWCSRIQSRLAHLWIVHRFQRLPHFQRHHFQHGSAVWVWRNQHDANSAATPHLTVIQLWIVDK